MRNEHTECILNFMVYELTMEIGDAAGVGLWTGSFATLLAQMKALTGRGKRIDYEKIRTWLPSDVESTKLLCEEDI